MAGHMYHLVRNKLIAANGLMLALYITAALGLAACGQSNQRESPVPPMSADPPVRVAAVSRDTPVLVSLYTAVDGENWLNNGKWLSAAPIREWYGVTTDDSGRVTGLALAHNGLRGKIPADLGGLDRLQALQLPGNRLKGEIPPELGDLTGLERLELWRNRLSGAIPPEVGNLANLELLDLGENELSGAIPPELGKLSRLKKIYLYVNELSGAIPPELGNLTSLEEINLSGNKLTGEIPPELGNLVNLWLLDLGANRLGGKVPLELAELTNLEELFLGGNDKLTGCIDKALREVQKNDLASLGLPFCSDAGPSMSGCTKK